MGTGDGAVAAAGTGRELVPGERSLGVVDPTTAGAGTMIKGRGGADASSTGTAVGSIAGELLEAVLADPIGAELRGG
jgi:hypothetical protein